MLQRQQWVDSVLELAELSGIADRLVGMPGSYGLGNTEYARFAVAAELASNPSVLVCGARANSSTAWNACE